jgi:hypothetical protein
MVRRRCGWEAANALPPPTVSADPPGCPYCSPARRHAHANREQPRPGGHDAAGALTAQA